MSLDRKLVFQKEVNTVDELDLVVDQVRRLITSDKTCLLLEGDLAAGKTTFVQKFGEFYNLQNIASPTFSLHHIYKNEKIQFHHFDLYRLSTSEDVETSGIWDVFSEESGILFIEWPSRIAETDIPDDWFVLIIEISVLSGSKRSFKLSRLLR